MGDNPRYTMYGSAYDMVIANKAALPKDTVVTVAGRYCETDLCRSISRCSRPSRATAWPCSPRAPITIPWPPTTTACPAAARRAGREDRLAVRREQYADMVRCDVCE